MNYSRKDVLADLIVVAVFVGLAWGVYSLAKPGWVRLTSGSTSGRHANRLVATGTAIDFDWSVQDLKGKTRPLSEFKNQVIFLNFWATWCGPCRMEMKSIEKLYAQFKDRGVAFLIITNEDPQRVRTFLEKQPYDLPIYTVAEFPHALKVQALPTTYLLSRDGKIAVGHAGARDWNKEKVVRQVENLIAVSEAPSS